MPEVEVFGEGVAFHDAVVPYIPGISLPNWMPTAGVIFLPSVGETIDKISTIIADTDITGAIEEGDIGEILKRHWHHYCWCWWRAC